MTTTIYLKDDRRKIVVENLVNILYPSSDVKNPISFVPLDWMFFDEDKNYTFNGTKQKLFIHGSAIQCVLVDDDKTSGSEGY